MSGKKIDKVKDLEVRILNLENALARLTIKIMELERLVRKDEPWKKKK